MGEASFEAVRPVLPSSGLGTTPKEPLILLANEVSRELLRVEETTCHVPGRCAGIHLVDPIREPSSIRCPSKKATVERVYKTYWHWVV
jgi:hypothetical protein